MLNRPRLSTCSLLAFLLSSVSAHAAKPTIQQALKLKPVQAGIEYDQPSGDDLEKCRVTAINDRGLSGWAVAGSAGQVLRRFVDSNVDNRIDQWCYYLNGIEVYRDIDSDHNGKAEQYRWLGTAGSRWGLDKDEDGKIECWKVISPEEVTAEVVLALRSKDEGCFRRVLLTSVELDELKLGDDQATDLKKRITRAKEGFREFAGSQQLVTAGSKWLQFGATRPGVIPAGTGGSKRDLILYDHAAAIVETKGRHGQVIVGTLVRVGAGWRVIDLPQDEAATGLFFTAVAGQATDQSDQAVGIDSQMQDLLRELEKIDQQLEKATGTDGMAKLNAQRADVLHKLSQQATVPTDRQNWIRQFADTVSAAVQTGEYPEGTARLAQMSKQLTREKAVPEVRAYVQFRHMTAEYGQQIQKPNADFAKIQEKWLDKLASFVKEYPQASDAAEAMLQLGIAEEFAGHEPKAARWYQKIVRDFPDSRFAAKATGARRRLEAVGKRLSLQGKGLDGRNVDLVAYQGSVVLLHYWATWCNPCKEDMQKIRALQDKFAQQKFVPIGVNVDHSQAAAASFTKTQRISWPQMHESGGLDSRLANELGVLTLPTMLLIDRQGKVVRRNIHVAELAEEIKKLLP
jgi:thiol-disulfide isomerase/thioredoxin